jgi:nucleoside-diphosphate-sugar epimerase
MKKPSIIITGASGFIGSQLTLYLIKKDFDVHIISRKTSDLTCFEGYEAKYTNHIYDGTIHTLKEIFKIVKPSHVFHLASLFLSKHDDSNITQLLESNVIFSTHIVDAMVTHDVKYLINTGTNWQHFEDNIYNPVNLYAASKQSFETILEFYIQTSELRVTTLKLFDTYGPNDTRKKILSLLDDYSKSNEALSMSPGNQKIDIVYIDDVIKAYLVAYSSIQNQTNAHMQYGITSNNPLSLKDLVIKFEKVLETKVRINWGKLVYREREVMSPWSNSPQLPGWKPNVGLEEGLLRTFKQKSL